MREVINVYDFSEIIYQREKLIIFEEPTTGAKPNGVELDAERR